MYTSPGSGFRPVLQGDLDIDYRDDWTRYDPDPTDDHEARDPAQHFLAPDLNHAASVNRTSPGSLRTAFYGNEENQNDAVAGGPDPFRTRHTAYRDDRSTANWRPSNSYGIRSKQNAYETDEEEWGTSYKGAQGFVSDNNRMPNYKPPVFRLWFLGLLLLIVLTALAMMELAVHLLPDGTKDAKPVAIVSNNTNLRVREELLGPVTSSNTVKWHQVSDAIHYRRQDHNSVSTIEPATMGGGTLKSIEELPTPPNFGSSSAPTVSRILDAETTLSTATPTSTSKEPTASETSLAIPNPNLNSEEQSSTTDLPSEPVSSSTASKPEPITCTMTVTLGKKPGPATITVPTVTVTVGGSKSATEKGGTDAPSPTSSSSLNSSCDVVVTKTIVHSGSFVTMPTSGGDASETEYITVGKNTVTITLPGGDEKGGENNRPIPEPTSTCYLKTVTVTKKADLGEITKTVIVDITVLPGGVAKRDAALPTADVQSAQLEARACIDGGVRTVTEYVAKPKTVTVTVYRVVTKKSRPKLEQPSNADPVISTTNRRKPTSVKTLPHDHEIPLPSDVVTKTTQVTLTDADGNLVVSTITGIYEATRRRSTTRAPLPSTDANGNVILKTMKTTRISDKLDAMGSTSEPNLSTKFTMITTTLRDANGRPTLTTSMRIFLVPTLRAMTDSRGHTTNMEELYVLNYPHTTTFVDLEGNPKSTATYYLLTSSTVLTDKDGKPTKTSAITYTRTASTRTMANSAGKPTTTEVLLVSASFPASPKPTSSPPKPTNGTDSKNVTVFEVYSITQFEYFAGLILPTIVATALTIPFRILDHVAKLYHPFHVLASQHKGARADQSICWETTGSWTFITRFQCFFQGQVLLLITGTLVLVSASLVPISAETIRVILQGEYCQQGQGNPANCAITVGVFPIPARITVGLLGLLAIFTIIAAAVLWWYRTGVATKPWSLSEIAGLSSNPKMQLLLSQIPRRHDGRIDKEEALWVLSTQVYTLDYWQDGKERRYGVKPADPRGGHIPFRGHTGPAMHSEAHWSGRKATPFYVLTFWGRALVLFILVGMLAIIITYNTMPRDTALGQFLSSESIALRVLITSIGMIITLFWSSYFSCIAFMSPYKMMHTDRNKTQQALNMNISTNSFSGLFRALKPSSCDLYLAAVAFTAILSEFLPTLLSNMPYKVIQTWLAHTICTWMVVGILALMVILIIISFFIDWPHMPVDPSTMVGAMYYISQPSIDVQRLPGSDEDTATAVNLGFDVPVQDGNMQAATKYGTEQTRGWR